MIRLDLSNRRNTVLFSVAALVLAVPYLFWIQNHYRAAVASEVLSLEGLQQASRLEPGNSEYRDMLGRYHLFVSQDTAKSIGEFEQAVMLNSHSSRYWLDLATAQGLAANTDAQRTALQRALAADPKTPKVAWEAGNFFLMDGQTDKALASFKTVVEYDDEGTPAALNLSWRATHDVDKVLAIVMPTKLSAHVELLRILYAQGETQAAMAVWRAMGKLNESVKISDAMPFAEYLILHSEIADAQEVWSGMSRQSPSLRPATSDGNLIVNGKFDEEIIPGGFSWHIKDPAAKTLRIDDREIHSGTASASFTFEGPAFADYGFSQLVPVKPGRTYELSYTAKSQEIVSTDGPRIMVEDTNHTNLATGAEWIGTHGWNEEKLLFTTKPETLLVRVFIGRTYGGGLIRGRFWLDNIRMYER